MEKEAVEDCIRTLITSRGQVTIAPTVPPTLERKRKRCNGSLMYSVRVILTICCPKHYKVSTFDKNQDNTLRKISSSIAEPEIFMYERTFSRKQIRKFQKVSDYRFSLS